MRDCPPPIAINTDGERAHRLHDHFFSSTSSATRLSILCSGQRYEIDVRPDGDMIHGAQLAARLNFGKRRGQVRQHLADFELAGFFIFGVKPNPWRLRRPRAAQIRDELSSPIISRRIARISSGVREPSISGVRPRHRAFQSAPLYFGNFRGTRRAGPTSRTRSFFRC